MARLVRDAQRVVGLYDGARQIGFARAFTDGTSIVYLAGVYVLPDYRGRGCRVLGAGRRVASSSGGVGARRRDVVAARIARLLGRQSLRPISLDAVVQLVGGLAELANALADG